MIDYTEAIEFIEEVQRTSDVEHVFIAFMDDSGHYRSIRSSELGASSVKPFLRELVANPSHEVACNVTEVTSSGSQPKGKTWEFSLCG